MIQQIQNRWNDDGPGNDTDDESDLLLPRRGAHELTGFEILEIVVGDGRNRKYDRRNEQHHQADDANGNVALGAGENFRIIGAAGS